MSQGSRGGRLRRHPPTERSSSSVPLVNIATKQWSKFKRGRHTDQVHELQALQQFAVLVLQAVGFVDHHAAPVQLPQLWAVGHYHLESGDQPVELQHAGDAVSLWAGRHRQDAADRSTPRRGGGARALALPAGLCKTSRTGGSSAC